MNSKKKLLFVTFALVLASGLAATGSTFAWFTTTRTATLTFGSATVENKTSDLKVTYVGSQNSFTSVDNTINNITISGINRVTDISGDGINFYKPIWSSEEGKASTIQQVTNATGYYIDFLVKIELESDSASATGLKVYLGEDTEIAPVDTDNAHDVFAVQAARMAVIGYDDELRTNPQLKHLYAPVVETNPKHLEVDASSSAYDVSGYILQDTTELKSTAFVTESNQADATYEIADLDTGSEAYVGFRFWIEGTDAETTNDKALSGMFKVALDIYALEV